MRLTDIRDIVRIIERHGFSKENNYGSDLFGRKNSKLSKFKELVIQNPSISDLELGHKVLGESFSASRYKSLKTFFISKSVHQLALIDFTHSRHSEHAQAIYKAYKYLFFIRTLLTLGNRPAAIHFTKRLFQLSKKYEIHFITVSLIEELRRDSVHPGKKKFHRKYIALFDEAIELYLTESKIEILEEQALLPFSESLFVDDNFIFDVFDSLNVVKALVKKNETYFGKLSYYRLQYIYYQISGNPLRSAEACQNAIQYMKTKPHMSPSSRYAEFAIYKLENYILLRDYKRGKEAARYCLKHINPGMILWFTFKQYEFLLMMQTLRFSEASRIYDEVSTHERFTSLSEAIKELWKLFGFTIQYVIRSEGGLTSDRIHFKKSYLSRNREFKNIYLNFPTYKKDKRGFNVAILILNILVALEDNNRDILLKQEEALSSYRFKYLNTRHCHQTFVLLKLIRLMTKNDFDLARIERISTSIEKELTVAKLKSGEIFENIQILPPEWVWKRMKKILEERS